MKPPRRYVIYRSTVVWVSLDRHSYLLECPEGHRWTSYWAFKVPGRGYKWMDRATVAMFSRYWGPGQKVQAPCPKCEHAMGYKFKRTGRPKEENNG